ncbi:MAG TPA: hypothetical protein VLX28_22465, partial [Thermoanaerobaculia bacterium]|nr:hypothetical protein [Thermoanaerobaculia bacterium]
MWTELKNQLSAALAATIQERFGVEHQPVLEVPPRRDLGDLSSPAATATELSWPSGCDPGADELHLRSFTLQDTAFFRNDGKDGNG